MKICFALLICTTFIFGCESIKAKHSFDDVKKTSLRYFITINYNSIANEMYFGEDEYLKSLYAEIASFETNITSKSVREKFLAISDPFDFAVSITKELD